MRSGVVRAFGAVGGAIVLLGLIAGVATGAFGTGGKTTVNVGGVNSADAVDLGQGGRIVAGGSAVGSNFNFAAVQLDKFGDPDSSFSGDGEQTTDLGGFDVAHAVAALPDGGVLLAGVSDAVTGDFQAALVQYSSNGLPDPGFSEDGRLIPQFGGSDSRVEDMEMGFGGNAVLAGGIEPGKMLVFRVKPNGKVDRGFGTKSKTTIKFEEPSGAEAVEVKGDGRIVVGGTTSGPAMDDPSSLAIARLAPRGELDESFSKNGKTTVSYPGSARLDDLALAPDGRMIAVGTTTVGDHTEVALTALKSNGKLDRSFGKGGKVTRDFGPDDGVSSVEIQGNGKIVIGGRAKSPTVDFLVARFTKNGKLDDSFSGNGFETTDFAGGGDVIQDIAIGRKDSIVAAGGGGSAFGFARYLKNGELDD